MLSHTEFTPSTSHSGHTTTTSQLSAPYASSENAAYMANAAPQSSQSYEAHKSSAPISSRANENYGAPQRQGPSSSSAPWATSADEVVARSSIRVHGRGSGVRPAPFATSGDERVSAGAPYGQAATSGTPARRHISGPVDHDIFGSQEPVAPSPPARVSRGPAPSWDPSAYEAQPSQTATHRARMTGSDIFFRDSDGYQEASYERSSGPVAPSQDAYAHEPYGAPVAEAPASYRPVDNNIFGGYQEEQAPQRVQRRAAPAPAPFATNYAPGSPVHQEAVAQAKDNKSLAATYRHRSQSSFSFGDGS